MDHPDGLMRGMWLAWGVLLVVPASVISATVIWYVRRERALQSHGGGASRHAGASQ
jgi:hypothetical protein